MQLKHCINPKVIVGLVVVAAVVWVFTPGAFAAALPLLVLAICPLSMTGMMYMMRGNGQGAASGARSSCRTADSSRQAQASSAGEESPAVEALRTQVAELEARLAAETGPEEAPAGQSSGRDTDR